MTANSFNSEEINLNIQPVSAVVDTDGSFMLNAPMLSSIDFDGQIPKFDGDIDASEVKPGYLIKPSGSIKYYPVTAIEIDDPEDPDPSGLVTINYLDDLGNTSSIDYDETDQVSVIYEDWSNKVMGTTGWGITSGGNAIFTNVGVRGRIEAEEGYISGTLTIGSGGTTTVNDLTTAEDLDGFVTDTDLITNGATVINGNNITTGVIQANLIDITTNALPNRGVKLTALGLEGFDGSGNRTFYLNTNGSLDITGYATDGELSGGLSGKINNGGAATDVNNNNTTISGGKIRTGIIESNSYSGVTDGSAFSSNGLAINLTTGALTAEAFRVDTNGNAAFKGNVQAFSGFFGSESINWSIGTEVAAGYTSAFMKSGTLKLYTATTGTPPVQHGIITLDNGSGLSAGSLSNALSVPGGSGAAKIINGLGNGLHIGTTTDYFFVPGTGNTAKPRIRSNGFDFINTSEVLSIRISNNELVVPSTSTINFLKDDGSTGSYLDYGSTNDILIIDNGGAAGGPVNIRASELQLNGTPITGGGGGGGVTSFKFGDTGPTETGAVAITGAEIITGINAGSITNGKLANSTIQIMSTTKSLGQSFVAGDIDGDVITANTLPTGKISNATNLFSIGGTGVARGNAVSTITGPLTIGTPATGNSLTVNGGFNNGLSVPTARGLDYVMNFGTSQVNLNRASTAITLTGVTVDGLSTNTSLFTLGSTAITAGNTVANYSLNYNWYLGTTAISLGRANAAATLTGITLSGAKITTPPAGTTAQPFLRWNSATSDITQVAAGSSLRYKEIIERSPEINSDWIDNIEIIKFKYNLEKEWFGDQAPIRIGLIAEEVNNLESINNVVEYDIKTGLPDAIEYDKIAILLIPEIKLLRQRVADLEARLDAAGL